MEQAFQRILTEIYHIVSKKALAAEDGPAAVSNAAGMDGWLQRVGRRGRGQGEAVGECTVVEVAWAAGAGVAWHACPARCRAHPRLHVFPPACVADNAAACACACLLYWSLTHPTIQPALPCCRPPAAAPPSRSPRRRRRRRRRPAAAPAPRASSSPAQARQHLQQPDSATAAHQPASSCCGSHCRSRLAVPRPLASLPACRRVALNPFPFRSPAPALHLPPFLSSSSLHPQLFATTAATATTAAATDSTVHPLTLQRCSAWAGRQASPSAAPRLPLIVSGIRQWLSTGGQSRVNMQAEWSSESGVGQLRTGYFTARAEEGD